jgi:glutathione S-transferase
MRDITLIIGNRNYSSWSLRAWLALDATGADFDEVVVPLGQPDTADRIRQHSPAGLVPALHLGGLVIWDSLAICEYLAEQNPEAGLWPADPRTRAVARSVTAEMHSGFTSVRGNMPMNIRASYPGSGRGPGVDEDIARITEIWETCRRDFGYGGGLLFGGFTLADAFFAPVVSRFRTYGVELDGAAADYAEAVWALPAMQDWVTKAHAEEMTVDRYDL